MIFNGFMLIVLLVALWVAVGRMDRVGRDDVAVHRFIAVRELPVAPATRLLVTRYLARHRRRRRTGGAIGFLLGLTIVIVRPAPFQLVVGFGRFPDLLVSVLAGVLAGVLSAESYHLSRRPLPGRVVSLERREAIRYVARPGRRAITAAGIAAALIPMVDAVTGSSGVRAPVIAFAVAAVAVVAVVGAEQRFIVRRARPAMESALVEADDAIRRASCSTAVHHAGFGLVLLLLGYELLAADLGGTSVRGVKWLTSFALLVGCIVSWRRSRVWVDPPASKLLRLPTC